jgi:ribosome recycling factor
MSHKELIDKAKQEFEKAFKFFEGEMSKIRTSRASPALVEDIDVSAFGSSFTIKQLGSISTPSNNQILIQPWDSSYIEPIQKAIEQSGLGMSAVPDGTSIRLTLPLLTEEYRHQLTRTLNEKAEQSRQTIRRAREDAWNRIQDSQKAKEITEDDKFKGKDELQKLIDEYNKKIKDLIDRKLQEIA